MDFNDRRGKPDSVKIIKVIQVEHIEGKGTKDDPVRKSMQYWSLKGELLAEKDFTIHQTAIKQE